MADPVAVTYIGMDGPPRGSEANHEGEAVRDSVGFDTAPGLDRLSWRPRQWLRTTETPPVSNPSTAECPTKACF